MSVMLPHSLEALTRPAVPAVEAASFRKVNRWLVWSLVAIGAVAYLLRVFVVAFHPHQGHWFHEDTIFYLENAQAILITGLPTLNKAPIGFSYILALLLKFGLQPKAIAFMVQPIVGALDCLLVYVLCKKMCRPRAGLVAAAICAVHPSLINSSSQLLSEDWAVLFLLLGLIAALSHRRRSLFAAGLLMGAACAIRSPCLAMLLGLVLWLMWTDRERGGRRAAALLLGALIPIGVVSIHLSIASQSPVFVTLQNTEANTVKPALGGFEALELEEQFRRGSYFDFAWHHPLLFAEERMISFITFASPWPFGDDRSLRRKGIMAFSDGFVLVASLIATISLWRRNPRSPWFVLVWLPCCLCFFYTLFFSNPRYRVPTLPLLVAFSTMVLLPQAAHSRIYTQFQSRLRRPEAAAQVP